MAFVMLVMMSPMCFLFSCIYIFYEMVNERETRMKESLKIMGLNKWMYPLSILLQRGIWIAFTAFCYCMMIFLLCGGNLKFG
jgi:hypothetical protein